MSRVLTVSAELFVLLGVGLLEAAEEVSNVVVINLQVGGRIQQRSAICRLPHYHWPGKRATCSDSP